MNDFRKNLYLAFKARTVELILSCLDDLSVNEDIDKLENGLQLRKYVTKWVDSNCLPMGDFDKERALKEIEEWSK